MQKFFWCIFTILCLGAVNAQRKIPVPSKATSTSSNIEVSPTSEDDAAKIGSRSQTSDNKRATVSATPPSASTTTTTPIPEGSSATYILKAPSGSVCTIIRVDALLTFTYRDRVDDETERDLYVPEDVTVTGSCTQEDNSFLSMRWASFALNWYFAKTPGGERWYMEKMEVKFNTSEKLFKHFPKPGRAMKLTTPKDHSAMLFPTPVGKSFSCSEETTVELTGSKDMKAAVLLRDLKLQPFIFKNDEFGPEFICSPGSKSYRDETAPLAVGSTLAVVVLLTVTGYGVYRYVKIKKVQYDTME